MNDLYAHMEANGLPCPDSIQFTGKLHRYSARLEKPNDLDEWYIGHEWDFQGKVYQLVTYGTWRVDTEPFKWRSWKDGELDKEAYLEAKRIQEKAKQAIEAERKEQLKRVREFYIALNPVESHPYLEKKQVKDQSIDIKVDQESLIIPRYNAAWDLVGYQRILPDGTKKNAKGCPAKGSFYRFQGEGNTVYVAEGYATAYSIYKATKSTVYCAFGLNNCLDIAAVASYHNKTAKVIYCRDSGKECDAVEEQMKQRAVKTVRPSKGSDFNDQMIELGIASVKKTLNPLPDHVDFFDMVTGPEKKPEYYLDKIVEKHTRILITSNTGGGKSYFGIEMAIRIASGLPFLKWKCFEPARVLYIENEMGCDELNRRVKQFNREIFECRKEPPQPFTCHFIAEEHLQEHNVNLYDPHSREMIESKMEDYDILFLDNLFCLTHTISENGVDNYCKASSLSDIQRWMRNLRRKNKTTILLHHSNADGSLKGSKNLGYQFETHIHLESVDCELVQEPYKAINKVSFPKLRKGYAQDKVPFFIGYNPESKFSSKWDFLKFEKSAFIKA